MTNTVWFRSFRCPDTAELFHRQRSRKFAAISESARRKLRMISDADRLDDLAAIPGNRFEALKGDWKGRHSIRIHEQSVSYGEMEPPKAWRWWTTTEEDGMMTKHRLPPIHPGEILREEFLAPLGLSANQLALALRVPATRVNDIINEKRGIAADSALRLSRYFGTTARFWMNMQTSWELEVAEDQIAEAVAGEVLPRSA